MHPYFDSEGIRPVELIAMIVVTGFLIIMIISGFDRATSSSRSEIHAEMDRSSVDYVTIVCHGSEDGHAVGLIVVQESALAHPQDYEVGGLVCNDL